MSDALLADLLLVLHLAFILFVLFGALLSLHRGLWSLFHLPALAWGIWIELSGGVCPLTPWEVHYRRLAGEQGYQGGFVEHYVQALVYPPGLTPALQSLLAGGLLVLNLLIYAWVLHCRRRRPK